MRPVSSFSFRSSLSCRKVHEFAVATMFKRYAKDLPEEVLNWRLGYAVLGMLGLAWTSLSWLVANA